MDKKDLSQKRISDFRVIENRHLSPAYSLLFLGPETGALRESEIMPGQFAQLLPPGNSTLLRRPISICNVDESGNQLWILVRKAGKGTEAIASAQRGDIINLIYPLGKGFSLPADNEDAPLLIGGGVGVAPLLYLGRKLREKGITPDFLIGAKTANDLLLKDELSEIGNVHFTTDDGSFGVKGLVTCHPAIKHNRSRIYCCGPLPMMKAVGEIARSRQIDCEVSLENVMGCGIGACLCCVEKTSDRGNVCVCSEGPVFNLTELQW